MTSENGTKSRATANGAKEVGIRMLYQLTGHSDQPFESFAELHQNQRTPSEVLDALAQGESLNPRDMTVVIVVDGIHDLPHNPEQMDSMMKTAIDSITEIVNVATQQFDTRGIRLFFFFFLIIQITGNKRLCMSWGR